MRKGGTVMVDWGLAALSFAAIAGGIIWVAFFAYELWSVEPPGMPEAQGRREHKPARRKAA
ncbi:MAG: hypothetical protein ABIO65_09665 [Nitrospiria bacterium]